MFTLQVSAFGTMIETSEKTVEGLSADYTVYLFNMGEEEIEVEFEVSGLERADYSGLENILVGPSNVSEEPREGWSYIDGRYVEPAEESFTVQMDRQRENSSMDFQLEVTARLPDDAERTIRQEIVHERVHDLRMETRTVIIDPEDEEEQELWREVNATEREGMEEFRGEREEENGELVENNMTGEDTEGSDRGSVNTLTFVLVAGILLMSAYLLTV